MERPSKACPVVLREREQTEILAFEHPLADRQLVKGTIEPDETPAEAALRELREEAGIRGTCVADLGCFEPLDQGISWSFHLIEVQESLADRWIHRTRDDGGHDFRFFWHPLQIDPLVGWDPIFRRALAYVRERLARARSAPGRR
jgi:8-oxo-dGTP pyrophosphatase MutT (NUDIX family)